MLHVEPASATGIFDLGAADPARMRREEEGVPLDSAKPVANRF
jgi:hypothetical protein